MSYVVLAAFHPINSSMTSTVKHTFKNKGSKIMSCKAIPSKSLLLEQIHSVIKGHNPSHV